jgi:hypothetical protein
MNGVGRVARAGSNRVGGTSILGSSSCAQLANSLIADSRSAWDRADGPVDVVANRNACSTVTCSPVAAPSR